MVDKGIELTVADYILVNIGEVSIDYDLDIFDEGLVSSLFAIELMTFLEAIFGIKVTMDDLDMENFKSVHTIAQFVRSKQGGVRV